MPLRAIEEHDLPMILAWRNSPWVRKVVREYRWLSTSDQQEWFAAYRAQRRQADFDQELMILVVDGKPVGVGGFVRLEWRNRRAELSFYVGDPGHDSEPIHQALLHEILTYGFKTLNLHKVYWPVYSHNPRLGWYQKLFKLEGILAEEVFFNGKWSDRYYLSLTENDFK